MNYRTWIIILLVIAIIIVLYIFFGKNVDKDTKSYGIILIIILLCIIIYLNFVDHIENFDCIIEDEHFGTLSDIRDTTVNTDSTLSTDSTINLSGQNGKAFIGAWVSDISCGKGLRHALLASALPQDWIPSGSTNQETWPDQTPFFENAITGDYETGMSNGYTKYLISVGGSNASESGWTKFLQYPEATAGQLDLELKKRGLMGLDLDLEGTTAEHQKNIKILVKKLKSLNSNYIVVYTVLLGSRDTFAELIEDGQMDYVALMLYDGGMYEANLTGAGCDWDGWAELFLSGCKAGCKTPLGISAENYCNGSSCSGAQPVKCGPIAFDKLKNKIVLAVIVDATGKKINSTEMRKAMDLSAKYGGAGIYMWVLPGWAYTGSREDFCNKLIPDMCAYNSNIGNYFQFNYVQDGKEMQVGCYANCGTPSDTCQPKNPCKTGCCTATACGKKKQGVTNENCAPCAPGPDGKAGQSWWPCDKPGFCECKN